MKTEMTIAIFLEQRIPSFCVKARQVGRLREMFPAVTFVWCRSAEAFLRALPGVTVALTNTFRPEWFGNAPKLRYILCPAAGRDVLNPVPLVPPPEVYIHYGTFHGRLMAETVAGLMLAFNRGILLAYKEQLAGNLWPADPLCEPGACRVLRGSRAAIVGFGNLGQWISKTLIPLGVNVTGLRRTPPDVRPHWFRPGDRVMSVTLLDAVLPTLDHLILALPSEASTDRLIGARQLARLPRHAVIYNVGRGNCIDEAALAETLAARRISGACLDVFAEEPLTRTSPLSVNLPGLVRMPHASAYGDMYLDFFLDEVIPIIRTVTR
jgi:phosphoglycerate dehydrogenase-like enzyme